MSYLRILAAGLAVLFFCSAETRVFAAAPIDHEGRIAAFKAFADGDLRCLKRLRGLSAPGLHHALNILCHFTIYPDEQSANLPEQVLRIPIADGFDIILMSGDVRPINQDLLLQFGTDPDLLTQFDICLVKTGVDRICLNEYRFASAAALTDRTSALAFFAGFAFEFVSAMRSMARRQYEEGWLDPLLWQAVVEHPKIWQQLSPTQQESWHARMPEIPWSPKQHHLFPPLFKKRVKCLLLARKFEPFSKLPKDIFLLVIGIVAKHRDKVDTPDDPMEIDEAEE